jgi:hypothetical protein
MIENIKDNIRGKGHIKRRKARVIDFSIKRPITIRLH